jgi:membrane protein required for colicin V production
MQTEVAPISAATFTVFDGLLLFIAAVSTLMAAQRGFIRVLFSLGGLIIGIVFASWEYLTVATLLNQWILSYAACQVIAFLVILLAVMLIFSIVAGILRKAIKTVGLGFADRLLGALFGLFRGILIGVALMMAVAAFVPDSPWLKNSTLAPYFLAGAHAVSFVVPEDFQLQVAKGATYLLQETPELMRPHTLTQPKDHQ